MSSPRSCLTGWYFHFSDAWTWSLAFIVTNGTFLLLFFLHKSQRVSDKVTHLKLDELIRAVEGARDTVAAVEDKTEKEIDEMKQLVGEDCADKEVFEKGVDDI